MNKNKTIKLVFTSLLSFTLLFSSCSNNTHKKHIHTFSTSWSSDETYHWHDSTCGHDVISDKGEHVFDDWVIDTTPTSENDGSRHHTCEICDYIEYQTIKYEEDKAVSRIYLSNPTAELFIGNSYTINPIAMPYDSYANIKYDIGDKTILKMENNNAIGLKGGNTLLFAYNDNDNDDIRDNNEPYAVMAFTVSESNPSIHINVDEAISINVNETKTLNYSVSGATPTGFDYGYYSEDDSICTISAGVVKGHKKGKTRVSVSWQGYRGYCEVTVNDLVDEKGLRASEILTSEDSIVLNKGESKNISYQILPSGAVDKLKSITSNNTHVVIVNNDNSITAVNGGSAVITLTTDNDKYTRLLVTVKESANHLDSYYNNYYGNLTWENGEDLKNKLHNIISQGVTPLRYDSPNWETNENADQDLYDYAYVNAVYNDNPILKSATQSGWQREHAFAASLMTGFSTGSAVKAYGRATDFHNLFAASAGANGSRGNKNLGFVNTESVELASKENCLFTKKAFEPNDIDKGRLARAIFYMSVMYNDIEEVNISETWTYKGEDTSTHSGKTTSVHVDVNEKALELVKDNVDYNRISINEFMMPSKESNSTFVEYYRSLIRLENPNLEQEDFDEFRELAYERYLNESMPYAIGYLPDLLKWNSFAVDHLEMQHNNSVYMYNSTQGKGTQGNRNPFVDYPQLVDYIYGDLKDEPGSIKDLTPTYLNLEMDKDEIHHYSVDSRSLPTFYSGTKPSLEDFNIKAIKNDLSEGILDKSKIEIEDYTFTDDDILNGKIITITTDKNILKVPVKVQNPSVITFDNCKFSYKPTTGNRSDYSGSGTSYTASFNGVQFIVTTGVAPSTFQNKNTEGMSGVTIGSGSKPINSLTFESVSSYVDVDAVFFYAAGTTTSSNVDYKVYVNNVMKLSGKISGSAINVIGDTFEKESGKIKIEFTNVGGIQFCGLAFNYK